MATEETSDARYHPLRSPLRNGAPPNGAAPVDQVAVLAVACDAPNKSGADDEATEKQSDLKKDGSSPSDTPTQSFAFGSLYRFATLLDMWMLAGGIVMAMVNGALLPLMALVMGATIDAFVVVPVDLEAVNDAALKFLGIAIGLFVTDYVAYLVFHVTAERQVMLLRSNLLVHLLHLDVPWYDQNDALQLSSRLSGDTIKIKDGMGYKLGELLRFTTQFVVGFVIGFAKGWDVTLVMCSVMPVLLVTFAWLIRITQTETERAQKEYAEAGAIAEETIGQMRTVMSLNAGKRAVAKYEVKARAAEARNIRLAVYVCVLLAIFLSSVWVMDAVGLWYGAKKVSDNATSPAEVFQAFFGILIGAGALAQVSPNLTAVAQATGAARALFAILDTPSAIDASSEDGLQPATCTGALKVVNVTFSYPSRLDTPVLVNYSLTIEPGQVVALVGMSGSGKSTLVSLLERFYDPQRGHILLDGVNINLLNVRWLRSQIAIVQQEPVLFQATIFENIAMGTTGVTRERAEQVAKSANAHDFIMALPQQYDTLVGEKGVAMSSGQKQRIAIARALVRDPKILILDEATSALDNSSERVVQTALSDIMARTRATTIVIAHRLSTVRHADNIVVLKQGCIAEMGTHDELIQNDGGIYANMFNLQQLVRTSAGSDTCTTDVDAVSRTSKASVHGKDAYPTDTPALRLASDASAAMVETNADVLQRFTMLDVVKLSSPDRNRVILGMLGAAVGGFALPGSSLIVSGITAVMTDQYSKWLASQDRQYLDHLYDDAQFYCICYLLGAIGFVFFFWLQYYSFKVVAEKLTTRLRILNFTALCRQNVGYFDDKAHATGALTADLNANATKVAMLSGDSQARIVQGVFTVLAATGISFVLGNWKLTLIMLVVFPLLLFGEYMRWIETQKRDAIADQLAVPGAFASERLTNIRTVVSFGLQDNSAKRYVELLEEPLQKGRVKAQINALALGFSSFIMMAIYALVFWYGGILVDTGDATFKEVLRSLMAFTMSISSVIAGATYFSESKSAAKAGATIMTLAKREVSIDAFSEHGRKLDSLEGRLEFQDVCFRYPTRPSIAVLENLNLTIEAGQTVAFCGPSGGGKSTLIALLERFYDPVRGQVRVDGVNLQALNLPWLRDQFGLVGQEPVLFTGSIAENIAYGLDRKPTQQEMENAARMANAHDFISNFPEGYDTQVGIKGEQLSGGQKQRLAIARVVLKDPSVLLLDEATSALDSESEAVVQAALESVMALRRRTTIIIAHRLATIRGVDNICVISDGRIAEQGTHTDLLAHNGIYARLVESASD